MRADQQFVRFALAGGLAAVANFGSRFVFSLWLPYAAAIVAAYLVGMVVAFVLMRRFVFPSHSRPVQHQVLSFVAVNGLAVVQTLVVSLFLAGWAFPRWGLRDHAEALAHAIGVAVPVLTSFLAHRAVTFR